MTTNGMRYFARVNARTGQSELWVTNEMSRKHSGYQGHYLAQDADMKVFRVDPRGKILEPYPHHVSGDVIKWPYVIQLPFLGDPDLVMDEGL